jgi:hypothetical protein
VLHVPSLARGGRAHQGTESNGASTSTLHPSRSNRLEQTRGMRSRSLTWVIGVVVVLGGCHSGRDVAPNAVSSTAAGSASPPQTPNAAGAPSTVHELPPSAGAPPTDLAPAEQGTSSRCETRKATIDAAFVEASRCTIDADCTTLMPGCPFGCTSLPEPYLAIQLCPAAIAAVGGATDGAERRPARADTSRATSSTSCARQAAASS